MRELAPGAVVAGYRIEALIGRGGMGVVYRAVQSGLERVVALKVIAPELLDDEDVRARFLTEARAAASVDHPNVIPVHNAGEEDGIAYIAMRFVAGDDLRSLVRRGGALDPAEAAEIVAQAGAALDAIHRAGFVHRDVKPANLLVDADRHVYLTDFGLAKAVLTRTGGTRTGQWVGTLDYIAPEQIRGGRIDARVDVYALGGVLHYALTGKVPFERQGDEAKLWAQLSAPPPVPSSVRRGLRGEFDMAVARAMAKTAEERYPSAGDLGRAARAAAVGKLPSEPERMVARGAAAPGAAPSEPGLAAEASTRTARPTPSSPTRRRAPLAAAAVLAVGAVAAVTVALALGDEPRRRAATERTVTPTASAPPDPTAAATPTATAAAARVVQTVRRVGSRPSGLAVAGADLWVMSPGRPRLTLVSTATGRERRNHPEIGYGQRAITAYRGSVYVASGKHRAILRLDARTGAIRARLPVPGDPVRLAVNHSGVWVGTNSPSGQPGLLLRYDVKTGERLQTITVAEGVGPIAESPDALWVMKRDTNTIARVEPGAGALVDVLGLSGPIRSIRHAGDYLYLVFQDEDTIARLGKRTSDFVTANGGHGPMQVLVAGGRAFVTARHDQSVLVLDPIDLTEVQPPIRVGLNPVAMAAVGRSLWVTSLDAQLKRIDYR